MSTLPQKKPTSTNARPSSAKPGANGPRKPLETPAGKVAAVAAGEVTWAEAIGLTRTEAYGIAHSAHRLLEHGFPERARGIVEGLIVCNPREPYFYALLGGICGRLGDDDAALKHYTAAIKLDPNVGDGDHYGAAHFELAEVLFHMDDEKGALDAALNDLVAATTLDPSGTTAHGKRALALARTTSAALHSILSARAQQRAPARR